MPLRLFSSLGREKRIFNPIVPGNVRMYVCGVTPYDVTHLGHAFSYVHFDTMRRYLEFQGNRVRYVQNVTDIDDDMIMVSKRQGGRPIPEIRDENDAIFRADLDRLNVLRPTEYPFATGHIPEIIESTRKIIENGRAYVVDGDVFFAADKFPNYGQLNGATLEDLAKRENPESKREHKKRHPLDFLLWQLTEDGEPSWESPWGPGRPGWSIECTAMSITHLGSQIDIHGGGSDLTFPHHENEIAQAESFTDAAPFCRWWTHNGMMKLDGVKMSKSLGNLVLARELMKTYEPDHLRMYLLSTHYRTDGDYHDGDLVTLSERYKRLKSVSEGAESSQFERGAVFSAFTEAMDDDLDGLDALTVLDEAAQRVLSGADLETDEPDIRAALSVLGFGFAGARGPANGDFSP